MEILLFGITKSIVGKPSLFIDQSIKTDYGIFNVETLKKYLNTAFPDLKNLKSLAVAVNNNYASDDTTVNENDEIALIPPVSGG